MSKNMEVVFAITDRLKVLSKELDYFKESRDNSIEVLDKTKNKLASYERAIVDREDKINKLIEVKEEYAN